LSVLVGAEISASSIGNFYLRKAPIYLLNRRLGGLQSRFILIKENKNLLTMSEIET
jgi:hypothetical protein